MMWASVFPGWRTIALLAIAAAATGLAMDFPAAAWHRGDVSVAQENSRAAISAALHSRSPNFECDIIDFKDESGKRVGLVSHDYTMKRGTGKDGMYNSFRGVSKLPQNSATPNVRPEPFMTVVELFEMIKARKAEGVTAMVSLDMKEEGDEAEEFGRWIGQMIRKYDFPKHVIASSFFRSNVAGVKAGCSEALVGGLVYEDHFALKFLDTKFTSLDVTMLGKATFMFGFLGKEEYPIDFVLLQDDVFFKQPEIADFWRTTRKVKFVGVFVHGKTREYTAKEWALLKKVDWLELDPPQMKQFLKAAEAEKTKAAK